MIDAEPPWWKDTSPVSSERIPSRERTHISHQTGSSENHRLKTCVSKGDSCDRSLESTHDIDQHTKIIKTYMNTPARPLKSTIANKHRCCKKKLIIHHWKWTAGTQKSPDFLKEHYLPNLTSIFEFHLNFPVVYFQLLWLLQKKTSVKRRKSLGFPRLFHTHSVALPQQTHAGLLKWHVATERVDI